VIYARGVFFYLLRREILATQCKLKCCDLPSVSTLKRYKVGVESDQAMRQRLEHDEITIGKRLQSDENVRKRDEDVIVE
jgi:hypothetical protein